MSRPKATSNHAPWVLGLGASHNGSACLLHGDEIVVAIQEERLSRSKRHRTFGAEPNLVTQYCLDTAGIDVSDLSMVVHCAQGEAQSVEHDLGCNRQLRLAHHGVPWRAIPHHLGHAISAFATSGFEESAVLVIDGLGSPFPDLTPGEQALADGDADSWEMISCYHANGTVLEPVQKHMTRDGDWLQKGTDVMPRFRSLGGMYSAVATQIFGDPMDAGKVMGLAPLGTATIPPNEFFTFEDGRLRFHDGIPDRFRHGRRWPEHREEYQNLARSVQEALEVAILTLIDHLLELSPSRRLCYAGGVALNCVTNERLFRETPYREVYIPPAAEDSGTAIGAAYWGLWQVTGENTRRRLEVDALGRPYAREDLEAAVRTVPGFEVVDRGLPAVIEGTVERLVAGQLGGWFQGRSELGPRALGRRSIVADPRTLDSKTELNDRIKARESFRPFAPVVLAQAAGEWFDVEGTSELHSPFMLRTWPFLPGRGDEVPSVAHVDGSGRVQTVDGTSDDPWAHLVDAFHRATGVPIILNTSFNGRGEPIVETPEDALWCMLENGLDFVALGDLMVVTNGAVESLLDLYPTFAAESYSLRIPLVDGVFSAEPSEDDVLVFQVSGPWGEREHRLPARLYPMLSLIDGTRNGWSLLRALGEASGRELEPKTLVRPLGALRRASVLQLRDEPTGRS